MPGTQTRKKKHIKCGPICYRNKQHIIYEWGWSPTPYVNKSCGVQIRLRKSLFRPKHIVEVPPTPALLQGRVGALRARSGRFDILLVVIYYPLVPQLQSEEEVYIKTITLIQEWLTTLLQDLHGRTSVFIGLDNCRFGTPREDAPQFDINPVGPLNPKKEGFLATAFRPLLFKHHLAVVNTFKGGEDSFYSHMKGRQYSSRPDNIITHGSFVPHAQCRILQRLGRFLQQAKCKKRTEHWPMLLNVDYKLQFAIEPPAEKQIDNFLLAQAVLKGTKRKEFLGKVITSFEQTDPEWDKANIDCNCNDLYTIFNKNVKDAALECFSKAGEAKSEFKLLKAERRDHILSRWTLRNLYALCAETTGTIAEIGELGRGRSVAEIGGSLPHLAKNVPMDFALSSERGSVQTCVSGMPTIVNMGDALPPITKNFVPGRFFLATDGQQVQTPHLIDSSVSEDAIKNSLEDLEKRIKRLDSIFFHSKTLLWIDQLNSALKGNDSYEVARLGRLLSGTSVGPGRRFNNLPTTMRPTAAEWEAHLGKQGTLGGMSCVKLDTLEVPQRPILKFLDEEMAMQVSQTHKDVRNAFRKMKNRKSTVPWSLPTEIWKIMLYPKLKWGSLRDSRAIPEVPANVFDSDKWTQGNLYRSFLRLAEQAVEKLAGIREQWVQQPNNSHCDAPDVKIIFEKIKTIYRAMFQTLSVPQSMNFSWMFFQDKGNGKPGTAAMRGLHRICPWGKALGKAITERGPITSIPHYCHGCIKGRRKETALLVQLCGSWRLRQCGLSHVTSFFDQANAFPSVSFASQQDTDRKTVHEDDIFISDASIFNNVLQVDASDQTTYLQNSEGVLQGHQTAPLKYVRTFADQVLEPWQKTQKLTL